MRSQRNRLGGRSPCHLRSHATATKASFTLGTARRKERTNMGAPKSASPRIILLPSCDRMRTWGRIPAWRRHGEGQCRGEGEEHGACCGRGGGKGRERAPFLLPFVNVGGGGRWGGRAAVNIMEKRWSRACDCSFGHEMHGSEQLFSSNTQAQRLPVPLLRKVVRPTNGPSPDSRPHRRSFAPSDEAFRSRCPNSGFC